MNRLKDFGEAIQKVTGSRNELARIEGHRLRLRLITPSDAEYVHGLRINTHYNAHLSQVIGVVADQRAWIEHYKIREAAGEELYYVIERMDGLPCGVVRLYEIGAKHFTWGSWILDAKKPEKAALESAVLSFGVGFDLLQLECALFEARLSNHHAIAFYRRFGAVEKGADNRNIYFEYSRDSYLQERDNYWKIMKREATS